MDHLEEAEQFLRGEGIDPGQFERHDHDFNFAKVHALIAIAEQLKALNERLDKVIVGGEEYGYVLNVAALTHLG